MQGIRDWALELETISLSNRTAFSYEVFCRLAKLIQVKSATLQRFQLAFKHLLLFEKNSRLHPIFQDFAFNFHTFSRSGKVVRKFPDFFKNSRLCTNPDFSSCRLDIRGPPANILQTVMRQCHMRIKISLIQLQINSLSASIWR